MPWELIKNKLAEILPENTMSLWIAPLEVRNSSDRLLELAAPDRFFCSWVRENFFKQIRACMDELGLAEVELRLVIAAEKNRPLLTSDRDENQLRLPSMPRPRNTIRALHPRYTFSEFMVGESNAMARTACEAIANNDSALGRYIFIESGPGLGKSHLTHAVAHKILAESPSTRLHYLTAQQLTSEMVKAIRNNEMEQFKEKFHNCDVLLMEDVHTLSGRKKTQEELAAALDILMDSQKRIVMTGKSSPREIPDVQDDLRSRLSGGLIATINPPDQRTRAMIIRRKSAHHALDLNDEVIEFLADSISGDIRQVESALVGLKARISLLGCQADLDLVKEWLGKILGARGGTISAEAIRDFVAKQFRTSAGDLMSKCRKREVAFPRQVAMYLSRKLTDQALIDIGKAFNRDHSTVVHSVKVITDTMNRDGSVRGQVDLLTSKIRKQLM